MWNIKSSLFSGFNSDNLSIVLKYEMLKSLLKWIKKNSYQKQKHGYLIHN